MKTPLRQDPLETLIQDGAFFAGILWQLSVALARPPMSATDYVIAFGVCEFALLFIAGAIGSWWERRKRGPIPFKAFKARLRSRAEVECANEIQRSLELDVMERRIYDAHRERKGRVQ